MVTLYHDCKTLRYCKRRIFQIDYLRGIATCPNRFYCIRPVYYKTLVHDSIWDLWHYRLNLSVSLEVRLITWGVLRHAQICFTVFVRYIIKHLSVSLEVRLITWEVLRHAQICFTVFVRYIMKHLFMKTYVLLNLWHFRGLFCTEYSHFCPPEQIWISDIYSVVTL